jgi:dTDP-4-amino-4,6-dideoxygalactose transaminase
VSMNNPPRFALFGDKPSFATGKPTGNLYQPSIEAFLGYSRVFYQNRRYLNDDLCRILERRLAEFHTVERAVCVNSGFWGHVMAISALALPGRREVITPAFGYRRADDMIAWAGFVPHFCDVDPDTLGLSVGTIMPALSEKTALILAPHPMVRCCDAQEIEEFGRRHGIPVVFDSVEAAYRTYNNRRIGGFGDAEVFSLHATKLLNGFEGGYITTNSGPFADRLDNIRRSEFVGEGRPKEGTPLNAILNEMHAALALASLDEVDQQVAGNKKKYDLYVAGLRTVDGLKILEHRESERPDYRLIVVRMGSRWPLSRDDTLRLLEAENILARPYYTPLNRRSVEYPRVCPGLPVTDAIFRDFMVLPSGAHVSEDDVEKVVDVLASIRRHGSELKARWQAI